MAKKLWVVTACEIDHEYQVKWVATGWTEQEAKDKFDKLIYAYANDRANFPTLTDAEWAWLTDESFDERVSGWIQDCTEAYNIFEVEIPE